MGPDWKRQLRNLKRRLNGKEELPVRRPPVGTGATKPPQKPPMASETRDIPPNGGMGGAQLPPEPSLGAGQTFNVGVDVGTSTDEGVCTSARGRECYVRVGARANRGVPSALCPSLVALDRGQLFFGHEGRAEGARPASEALPASQDVCRLRVQLATPSAQHDLHQRASECR